MFFIVQGLKVKNGSHFAGSFFNLYQSNKVFRCLSCFKTSFRYRFRKVLKNNMLSVKRFPQFKAPNKKTGLTQTNQLTPRTKTMKSFLYYFKCLTDNTSGINDSVFRKK